MIHIASFEWERVEGLVIGLGESLGLPVERWSHSTGIGRHDGVKFQPKDPDAGDPIEVLRRFSSQEESTILFAEDIHPYLDHHQLVSWVKHVARLPQEPRKLLILGTPLPVLPPDLRKEVPTLELPLPDAAVLKEVLLRVAAELNLAVDVSDEALLQAALGLTVMQARLAYAQAAVEYGRLDRAAVPRVAAEKERIIRESRVLEFIPSTTRLEQDVGGLDLLKDWLRKRGRAYGPGARDWGLDPPKGVLLLGVQGCGKSLLAKAVAAEWQFPLLRFDMGRVFGGVVGQSEGNMRLALQVAQALAPCVLWIDEIEKGLAGVGSSDVSDGGTTARVVGTFLTWMQERTEPVFVVATANRIDQLPPELLRKGRFDEIFFVDLPTQRAREAILAIHLRRKRRHSEDFSITRLATAAAGFSGAELEEAIREGLYSAFDAGVELADQHILEAIEATWPLSRTMREELDGLRRWARVRARPASSEQPEALPPGDTSAPRLRQEQRNPFIPERG
ncbi:AAA family ATPase [Sorangium sp. So ce128]|uniref:AAA family ATPase n=1 Tax=Sorangium sp. So ce128 TaxID=3133281 RepID=UPI003F62EA65